MFLKTKIISRTITAAEDLGAADSFITILKLLAYHIIESWLKRNHIFIVFKFSADNFYPYCLGMFLLPFVPHTSVYVLVDSEISRLLVYSQSHKMYSIYGKSEKSGKKLHERIQTIHLNMYKSYICDFLNSLDQIYVNPGFSVDATNQTCSNYFFFFNSWSYTYQYIFCALLLPQTYPIKSPLKHQRTNSYCDSIKWLNRSLLIQALLIQFSGKQLWVEIVERL